jgi:5-methylcytosine-specific restriction protein A
MTPRRTISAKARKTFLVKNGACSLCGGVIDPKREAWQIEHTIPLAMGGADDATNWTAVHAKCHKAKTRQDVKNIAQAKRRETKHLGATAPPRRQIRSAPFPKQAKPEKIPLPPRRSLYTESST